MQHLELVEDAVQSTLMKALETWTLNADGGQPENPSGWLFRVAQNSVIEELRRRTRRERILRQDAEQDAVACERIAEAHLSADVEDALLRMLFVCCDEDIPIESQLAMALKTLCGFSTREIALRLFTSEANIYKRLARGRSRLREEAAQRGELHDALSFEQLASRLPAVQKVLYLLFTEGYLSSHAKSAIREELCDEAIRLGEIVANHRWGQDPETYALLALMHLHRARIGARQDDSLGLLLLEEQNRTLWNQAEVSVGLTWLARSAQGDCFSRYHAEAGIAAEHCLAPSFGETRWERVAECYSTLERLAPSPLHTLNRAVAIAEWQGPEAGLAIIESTQPPTWLAGSYLWSATLADLHRRCRNVEKANRYADIALASAPTGAVKTLLRRRLGRDSAV